MSETQDSPDEIARLANVSGAAVGVHRAPTRLWTRFVAAFGIFLLAGSITYGYFFARSKSDEIGWLGALFGSEPNASPSPSPSFSWTPVVTPSASPSVSPSPSETEAPPNYRFKTKITVYNDTKISGLAAKIKAAIRDGAEFKNVSTADWDGARPPANVIRYNDPKLRDTVELLSELLDISTVAFGITESTAIEIVLVSDPLPDPSPAP